MMTPQEIQEKTFAKAVFGGYDMQAVDEFVEPLAQDYIELYRENAVLKSKMKVLVKKLEEYRDREAEIRDAEENAQKKCDAMLAEAQKKSDELLSDAELQSRTADVDQLVAAETERLNGAKKIAQDFIAVIEQDVQKHLEQLEALKTRDLTVEEKKAAPASAAKQPYNFDSDLARDATRNIAAEIDELLTRQLGAEESPAAQHAAHPDSPTIKFSDLQFGKNYDPTAR